MFKLEILGVSVPSDSCIHFADSCRNYGVAAQEEVSGLIQYFTHVHSSTYGVWRQYGGCIYPTGMKSY